MLSEYGESTTASEAAFARRGHSLASARNTLRYRGARSNDTARRPSEQATAPIVPDPAIGSTTSSPGRVYRRTRVETHRAGGEPLNDEAPASGGPADWVGKAQAED